MGGLTMFGKVKKFFKYMRLKALNDQCQQETSQEKESQSIEAIPISISELLDKLEDHFAQCSDFVVREVELAGDVPLIIHIAYIEGLVNQQVINDEILKPIMLNNTLKYNSRSVRKQDIVTLLRKNLISNSGVHEVVDFKKSLQDR